MIEVSRHRRKRSAGNTALGGRPVTFRGQMTLVSRESSPTRRFPQNGHEIAVFMNQILFLQRNKHARSLMRLAICKQTARGETWLVGYALGPEWGSYEEALHFHSFIEAEMTFKFLPRADRRSASIVDWPVLPHLPILMTGT